MRRILLASGGLAALFSASAAMAQAAGDECSTAVALVPGQPANFSTADATGSTDAVSDAQCTGTFLAWGEPGTNPDVWFAWTPENDGTATFFSCGFDTSMVLYTGTCGNLTQVACNGDGTGATCSVNFYSRIADFSVTGGTTYYVRIGGYQGDTGAATLELTYFPSGGTCGSDNPNSCTEASPDLTPGCSDAACCSIVCGADSFCCDTEWDQTCADTAIASCGFFIYSCTAPNNAVANDCAPNALVLNGADDARNFSNVGCNTDGPIHEAATCQSGNEFFFNDIWYRGQAIANGVLRVNTCNSVNFDTKLAIYAMGSDPAAFNFNTLPDTLIACNDDGDATCQEGAPFASDVSTTVVAGQWYLIRLATFDNPGSGTVFFNWPEPCALEDSTVSESEACGEDTNGGCNSNGAVQAIGLGDVVAGTFWKDPEGRDTDFYEVTITEEASYTFNVNSANFVQLLILSGDVTVPECGGISVVSAGSGACPTTATACLAPGTYFVFVGIPFDAADTACGSGVLNEYSLSISSSPAVCPLVVASSCEAPGPDSATLNLDPNTVGPGLVACAVAGPTGGTTVNSFARVFAAGTVSGGISCLNFGAWAARALPEGLFFSDIPLPATIGIYRDLDGGEPRCKTADGGVDGCDLEVVWDSAIIIPGGVYKGTINFEEPLCVDEFVNQNLVVIIDFPSLLAGVPEFNVPPNSGYQLRAGGNAAGPGGITYCRLSCADAAGQYVLTETLGNFTTPWLVELNGDFATCDGGGTPCPSDLNGDGQVGGADLGILLQNWGNPFGGADLGALLQSWGACP